jgi:hypothetical protein
MDKPQPISVSAMILCDGVATDSVAHKTTIVGASSGFRVLEFPTVLPPFALYVAFSEVTREVELQVQIVDPDDNVIHELPPAHIRSDRALVTFEYDARFADVEIQRSGHYFVRLLADQIYIMEKRFVILYGDEEI